VVKPVKLSGTTAPGQTFESLIAIDETGTHNERIPTVVAASFITRRQSEDIVKTLIENGAEPWLQKSTDLDTDDIYDFFNATSIPTFARASWESPTRGQRALMSMEATKDVIPAGLTREEDITSCLILLDGRVSNYGGRENLLRSRTEILDDYFEDQHGVNIAIATLEKADKQYPEVTAADCACKVFRDRIENGTSIESLDNIQRFDTARSVPSVSFDDRIYELAPKGVVEEDTFESKVAAWIDGRRPSAIALGEMAPHQFERLVTDHISDEDISQYIIATRKRLGSQQA
jgi:hypothetical protein